MANTRNYPVGTAIIGVIFVLTMLATWWLVKPPSPPVELQGVMLHEYRQLHPFELKSSKNGLFTNRNLQGKWSFIFFGFVSCPDICPATLYVLGQVKALLKDDAVLKKDEVQFVFVSVDPQRDTPERLRDYVSYFDQDFIGATNHKTAIDNFSRQLNAGYIIEPETAPGIYNVIHTGAIFLIDPLGRSVASFSQPHYATTIHEQFVKIRTYFSGS